MVGRSENNNDHMLGGVGDTKDGDNDAQSSYAQCCDAEIDSLGWPGKRIHESDEATEKENGRQLRLLCGAVQTILDCIGEDTNREGLLDTPLRYAKALLFFTKGYKEHLDTIVNNAIFHEEHNELVLVKDVEIFSLCEHHLVPFTGKMHIGYIPDGRVIGLSKLARIAEMFSRRLQVQERLTKEVALAIFKVLSPRGVAVIVESSHLCMAMRGVQKSSAITVTSSMLGSMRSDSKSQAELWELLRMK